MDINAEFGQSAMREIETLSGKDIFIGCDVTKEEECQRIVETTWQPSAAWAITQLRLGGLEILSLSAKPVDPDGFLPNRQVTL